MPTVLLLAFVLIAQAPRTSPFNLYAAHLEPVAIDSACRIEDISFVRNLAIPFRARVYPGRRVLPFRNGRFDDRPGGGRVEWSTMLEREESVTLGREPAVLLGYLASHLEGTGSASHVLVVRCRAQRVEIVFEAGGEGVQPSYSGSGDLTVTYPFWRPADSHAAPSRSIEEHYRWNAAGGRFALVRRTERTSNSGRE